MEKQRWEESEKRREEKRREEKRRVLRGWRKVFLHLVKREQNVRICSSFKNNGRRGTLEEEMQRCIFSGRHSTRDMFIRDVI